MYQQLLIETAFFFSLRIVLLLSCRKYLLKTLYSDLKTLSSSSISRDDSPPEVAQAHRKSDNDDDVELSILPPPSTHTPRSASFIADGSLFHATVSRILFSWAFAESCMLFLLLVFQGIGSFTTSARLLNWRFSLFSIIAIILVFIPASISLLLALGNTDTSISLRRIFGPRVLLNLIPVAFYLFALSYIPLPAALVKSDTSTIILSRLIVLGTVILGALSGFGAISNAWPYLPCGSGNKSIPSENEVASAERALQSVREDLSRRRLQAERRLLSQTQESWISRVGTSIRGGDSDEAELRGLEALEYQMGRNVDTLKQRRAEALFSQSLKGKLLNFAGAIFALYCLTRIGSAVYNVSFLPAERSKSNTNYSDLLSHFLAYAVSSLPGPWSAMDASDIASFARQLSLVLVGLIIMTSIRLVLRSVTRMLHVTSRSLGASLMLLVLGQVMAIYLLSTIVQMRASFPPPSPSPGTGDDGFGRGMEVVNLFSTIPEYELFGRLFDWAFLVVAGLSVFVRWGAEKVNGMGDVI